MVGWTNLEVMQPIFMLLRCNYNCDVVLYKLEFLNDFFLDYKLQHVHNAIYCDTELFQL
jgi:hypothetical protein